MPNRFAHPAGIRMYIAGPMSGRPDHNFPAFHAAAAALRAKGYVVLSPAEMFEHTDRSWKFYMRHALQLFLEADAVYFLEEFSSSRGAKVEHFLAWSLDIPMFYGNIDRVLDLHTLNTEDFYGTGKAVHSRRS